MKKKTAIAMAACAGIIPAAMPLSAAEQADTIPSISLHQISVTAQRADHRTPVAFTNVTADQLENTNTGRDIPYLLQMTPSVVTTSDAGTGIGYSSLRIRGTDGSRVNVTANGVPINNSESHNVYWVNLPDLASSLRDIQIQRGVGTSTNGAGAFGGSINMVTEAPSSVPYSTISGTYGSYNTHKETIKVGTGLIGDHWAAEARFSNIGSNGYIDRASSALWSYFGQLGYYTASTSLRLLAFGGKERTYMAWDYASLEDMEKYGRRYNPCGKYTDTEGHTAYYPDQYDNYITHNFQLIGKHRFDSHWTIDAAMHFTKGDGYYEQYKTSRTLIEYGLQPFYIPVTGADGTISTEKVKKSDLVRLKNMDNKFGGGLFNVMYHNGGLDMVFGGAANAYFGRHFGQVSWIRNYVGPLDPLHEYYRNNGRKFDVNAYARASYDITAGLSAYADMQYRHIHYTIRGISDTYDYNIDGMQRLDVLADYNFFNPKLGLNYTFGAHRLYASWAVAHKEPTRDNFIDCDPDRQPSAERLDDFEIGWTLSGSTLSAGVNLYYMDYRDQLVATGQLSDTGNPISVNVPRSYRAGIELQAAWRPVRWFEWQCNATISRNRIKNFTEYIYEDEWTNPITIDRGNTRIAFSPDFTLNNAFNFNACGFDASIQTHYVSRQYLTNAEIAEQSLDSYIVTDLMVGYTFKVAGIKKTRIGIAVNNLFSTKYFSNGYVGAGYYIDHGEKVIYRYAGFAAQAPANLLFSLSLEI